MQTPADPTPSGENNSDTNSNLSSDEIKKLTSQLSQEIDEEIKKQFAQNQVFDRTQEKVNEILKKEQEVKKNLLSAEQPTSEQKQESKVSVTPSLPNASLQRDEAEEIHYDPLRSSVDTALLNLKEGDNVSQDWILKKILTTSFGNNKSSFYELQNKAGALWTLNREEMREVLKSEIVAKNSSQAEPPNLGPENSKVQIKSPDEQILKQEINEPEDTIEKTATKISEEKVIFDPEKVKETTKELDLNKKQIELVNKIHADKNLWETFTTFSPELWSKVYQLYESGKLTNIGIDAHPLLDQLESSDFETSVTIEKDTNFAKLFSDNGYNLTWSQEDALILGCHILANYEILNTTVKKVEGSGIAVSPLQSKAELIKLISKANSSDKTALNILQEALRFLPVNGKFNLLKPSQLESLKRYI